MSNNIELSDNGRFLFEGYGGQRISGVVEELTETSAFIRWDNGNSEWCGLHEFKPMMKYRILEKLKPRP